MNDALGKAKGYCFTLFIGKAGESPNDRQTSIRRSGCHRLIAGDRLKGIILQKLRATRKKKGGKKEDNSD